MGGSALLHTVTFAAVIVMILLTVWIVLLLESGGQTRRTKQGVTKPSDHSGQVTASGDGDALPGGLWTGQLLLGRLWQALCHPRWRQDWQLVTP